MIKVLNIELKEHNTLGEGKWDGKKRWGKDRKVTWKSSTVEATYIY